MTEKPTPKHPANQMKSYLPWILALGFLLGLIGVASGIVGYFLLTETPPVSAELLTETPPVSAELLTETPPVSAETAHDGKPPRNRQPAWLSLSAGAFTATGALVAAWLIFHRGELDRTSRETIERSRHNLEWRKTREESRNQRREGFGTRMATAIDHLGSTNITTQCAGIIELGGLADDWAALAKEITSDDVADSADEVEAEAARRQQEIIDLIFKKPLPQPETPLDPLGDPRVATKTSLLRAHLPDSTVGTFPHSWAMFDLDNADLARVDRKALSVRALSLEGTTLTGVNLKDVPMAGANLTAVNLTEADLIEANLTRARLDKANLTKANLTKANLIRANLSWANLTRANLTEAKLRKANLNEANLTGADLCAARLREANLIRANLTGAHLAWAKLPEADLTWANLNEANLFGAKLTGANLTGANLTGANLKEADLTGADLTWVPLAEATLTRLPLGEANRFQTNLTGSNLTLANLAGANLADTNIAVARSLKGAKYTADTIFPVGFDPGQHRMRFVAPDAE